MKHTVPQWVIDVLTEILPEYSGPITLDCRNGRIKRVVPVMVYEEPEAASGRAEPKASQPVT